MNNADSQTTEQLQAINKIERAFANARYVSFGFSGHRADRGSFVARCFTGGVAGMAGLFVGHGDTGVRDAFILARFACRHSV